MTKPLSVLCMAALFTNVSAQKLPTVQQNSLKPPAAIKIDGKATEWTTFEAYNPATELHYTIANDDKRLYLIAQTSVETAFNRIINGGIKLVVQKTGAKNNDNAAFVKFPFMQNGETLSFSFARPPITVQQGNTVHYTRNTNTLSKEEEEEQLADSLAQDHNKKIKSKVKLIYTNAIAGITEPLAIYNDKGVEAAIAFDSKKTLTCEIAIDLHLLGISPTEDKKFAYHLVVNGEPNKFSPTVPVVFSTTSANGTQSNADEIRAMNEQLQARHAVRSVTTDFWGEYTLAK